MRFQQEILLLGDTCQNCQNLSAILCFLGHKVVQYNNPQLTESLSQNYDAVILCQHADTTIESIHKLIPNIPLLMLGNANSNDPGIVAHIQVPIEQSQLSNALQLAYNYRQQLVFQLASAEQDASLTLLMGESSSMQQLRRVITQVAKSDSNVLILGESGTGKELVASSIHKLSKRHTHHFVPVNCGAIPGELMESELFGHEKGAFTGAISKREGRFELADGGTLFLDEIGDMPLPMQVKLLRVLQEHCFEHIGSNKSIEVDVRIIAATHKNLEEAIIEHLFREDLYYRLNVFPIHVQPLRKRREDIPILLQHYISVLGRSEITLEFTPAAKNTLGQYPWPGNIRELANLVEHMMVLFPNQTINVEQLPEKYQNKIMSPIQHSPPIKIPAVEGMSLKQQLIDTEVALITQAIEVCNGNITKAARYLEIGRTTLIEKMRKYKLRYKTDENQEISA